MNSFGTVNNFSLNKFNIRKFNKNIYFLFFTIFLLSFLNFEWITQKIIYHDQIRMFIDEKVSCRSDVQHYFLKNIGRHITANFDCMQFFFIDGTYAYHKLILIRILTILFCSFGILNIILFFKSLDTLKDATIETFVLLIVTLTIIPGFNYWILSANLISSISFFLISLVIRMENNKEYFAQIILFICLFIYQSLVFFYFIKILKIKKFKDIFKFIITFSITILIYFISWKFIFTVHEQPGIYNLNYDLILIVEKIFFSASNGFSFMSGLYIFDFPKLYILNIVCIIFYSLNSSFLKTSKNLFIVLLILITSSTAYFITPIEYYISRVMLGSNIFMSYIYIACFVKLRKFIK